MDWDKLRIFHAVAEAGSFTKAGSALNMSQSAVSRQISALEETLKVPLFRRHARGLILTEQGEMLYGTAQTVMAQVAMTEAKITESQGKPKGLIKITTTIAFGTTWLTPRLKAFMELYPDISIALIADDQALDLSTREADVAIRVSKITQPDLIQRHLLTFQFNLYASKAYIKKYGEPKASEGLAGHRLILYGDNKVTPFTHIDWPLEALIKGQISGKSSFYVNSIYGMYRAAVAGTGITALPDYIAQESPELVRICEDVEGPKVPAYFVYPAELRHSKRIAVLRDFLLEQVKGVQF